MHSGSEAKITILRTGLYNVGGVARFANGISGGLRVSRYSSTGTLKRGGVFYFGNILNIATVSGDVYLEQGDYVQLEVFAGSNTVTHNSTGVDSAANTRFWARLLP